jgi:hypothetical protein
MIRAETRDGVPVIPLIRAMDYCLERKSVYEPAARYLRKKYGANLGGSRTLGELRGVFKKREKAVKEGIRELEEEHRKEARRSKGT